MTVSFLNPTFDLSPGIELDEIVVEFERPLMQKDAVGVPKIVNAEEIINLPYLLICLLPLTRPYPRSTVIFRGGLASFWPKTE